MLKIVTKSVKDSFKIVGFSTIFLFLLAPIFNLYNLASGYVQKLLVDAVTSGIAQNIPYEEAAKLVITIGLIGFIFAMLYSLLHGFFDYYWGVWNQDFYRKYRLLAIEVLKDVKLSYYVNEPVGRVREKIGAGVDAKVQILITVFYYIVPEIVLTLIAVPILFSIDPVLTLISFSGIPFFVIIRVILFRKVKKPILESRKAQEDFGAIENEFFNQIRVIKAFNKTSYQQNLIKKQADKVYQAMKRQNLIYRFFYVPTTLTSKIPVALITVLAGFKALKGEITPGDIFLYTTYVNAVYQPLWNISSSLNRLQDQAVKAERLDEILAQESEFAEDVEKPTRVGGDIVFENVLFEYEDKRKILKGASFSIPEKDVVAIVGPSGVGKSTIVKLLMRFEDPTGGKITIGGKNITSIPKVKVRDKIGMVFQDSFLFNDTVSNNIRFGKTSATMSEVVAAAKKANAHDFITKLPKAYRTLVGERGVKLSGGEAQRVNLARAFIKNPNILILDEATSSLDSESEKLIQDALWKFVEGRTTIIIAHRLATVMRADKIIVLDKGRVAEEGTHLDLLAKDGLYAKLFKIQSGALLLAEDDKDSTLENEEIEKVGV